MTAPVKIFAWKLLNGAVYETFEEARAAQEEAELRNLFDAAYGGHNSPFARSATVSEFIEWTSENRELVERILKRAGGLP